MKERTPHILSELVFAPHQPKGREDTVILPLLQKQGIFHAISIGPKAQNMAERFEPDTIAEVRERQEVFLNKNGIEPLVHVFLALAVPVGVRPKIQDITLDMVKEAAKRPAERDSVETLLRAECLFTTLEGVPLANKPADCPSLILTGITKDEQRVLGNAHLGRPQVNERVTEEAIEHLLSHYGCSAESIMVGVAPSIGPQAYFIKKEDQEERHLVERDYWEKYAWDDTTPDGTDIIHIDVLGKILSILDKFGIPPEHIEAYGHDSRVDTYSLASKTPPQAHSSRYSTATNQPERNGRILVVAQLPISS